MGPPRTGKSKLARLFAILHAEGAFKKLKHRTIFFTPTSQLASSNTNWDGNTLLEHIVEETKKDRDKLILVLEEFQGGAPRLSEGTTAQGGIFEELKPLIEEDGKLPLVIAITTQGEYDKHIAGNEALAARFCKIDVGNTNEEETVQMLEERALQDVSQPIALGNSLRRIYQITSQDKQAPQPHTSIELLKKCIQSTSDTCLSKTQEELIGVTGELRSRYTHLSMSLEEMEEDINELRAREAALEKKVAEEKTKIEELRQSKRLFYRVRQAIFKSAQKISLLADNQQQCNQLVLLRRFLRGALEKHIEEQSAQLGVKTIISQALVEEVHKSN